MCSFATTGALSLAMLTSACSMPNSPGEAVQPLEAGLSFTIPSPSRDRLMSEAQATQMLERHGYGHIRHLERVWDYWEGVGSYDGKTATVYVLRNGSILRYPRAIGVE